MPYMDVHPLLSNKGHVWGQERVQAIRSLRRRFDGWTPFERLYISRMGLALYMRRSRFNRMDPSNYASLELWQPKDTHLKTPNKHRPAVAMFFGWRPMKICWLKTFLCFKKTLPLLSNNALDCEQLLVPGCTSISPIMGAIICLFSMIVDEVELRED